MRTTIIILLVLLSNLTFAQDSLSFNKKYMAKNNLSIDLTGVGLLYSVNYERNFSIKDNSFHTLRAGISYIGSLGIDYASIYLPVSYFYSIGKKKSKFLVGLGLTFFIDYNPSPATFKARQYVRQHPTQKQTW